LEINNERVEAVDNVERRAALGVGRTINTVDGYVSGGVNRVADVFCLERAG
jgi:hypothetical protein